MRLGCCGAEDRLEAIRRAGYDYVEPGVPVLRADLPDDEFLTVRRHFRKAAIRPEAFNLFVPGDLKITGDSVDFQALTGHVQTVVRRASELGAEIIVFGSGGARNVPDGFPLSRAFEQLGAFCEMAADTAHPQGITVVVEPLFSQKCNIITSVAEGAELVREVNRPGLALLADLFHMEMDGEPWQNLQDAASLLKHIHLPVPSLDILASEGPAFSHGVFLKALRNAGYDGRISVEDNGGRFVDFGAEARLVRVHLTELWEGME